MRAPLSLFPRQPLAIFPPTPLRLFSRPPQLCRVRRPSCSWPAMLGGGGRGGGAHRGVLVVLGGVVVEDSVRKLVGALRLGEKPLDARAYQRHLES